MGNKFRRSSVVRSDRTKNRWRKGKQKHLQSTETIADGEKIVIKNEKRQRNSNNKYDDWNESIRQQQLSNINDPPGAPRTYSINFPMDPNDPMNQSWSLPIQLNRPLYSGTSHPMVAVKPTFSYDPDQYIYTNTFSNPSQDERISKRVQFARPIEQQITLNRPLVGTQSWHESSLTNIDASTSTGRQEPVLSKPSAVTQKTNTSVEKPIYVGIDHRATLAERGQSKAAKRHRKSNEKNNSTTTTNHRSKQREASDSSNLRTTTLSNKSFETVQGYLPSTHRILTTTSTSTNVPPKSIQHVEQPIVHDNETKKTRNNRSSQHQHVEQQVQIEKDTKATKIRGHVSQQKHHHHQPRGVVNRTNSPDHREGTRRMENKQQIASTGNTGVTQTQPRQKQSTRTNITRTRV